MFSSVMTDGQSEDGGHYISLPCFQVSGSSLFRRRVIYLTFSPMLATLNGAGRGGHLSVGQSDIDGVGTPAFRPSAMDSISACFTGGKRCSSNLSASVMVPLTVH